VEIGRSLQTSEVADARQGTGEAILCMMKKDRSQRASTPFASLPRADMVQKTIILGLNSDPVWDTQNEVRRKWKRG
jgi:hypothetical protein